MASASGLEGCVEPASGPAESPGEVDVELESEVDEVSPPGTYAPTSAARVSVSVEPRALASPRSNSTS